MLAFETEQVSPFGIELALLLHASSSRPESVTPLDGEQWRRLGRWTLLLQLAKQVAAAVGSALFQLVQSGRETDG